MAERSAYSNVIDSTMTFDEYVEFSGIEPGTPEYIELQSAYKSAQASIISVDVDFTAIKEYLANPKNAEAVEAALENLNTKYASSDLEVSVANWVSDPNTIVLRDINGNIISIYYMDYGEIPVGTPYPGLTNGYQIATSASQSEAIIRFERGLDSPAGAKVQGFIGSAASSILSVACASAFAKNIRGELYEKSKQIWGKDMYEYDPDWWDAIYAGRLTTGFRAFVAENLLAVDPDTDSVTIYVDDRFASAVAAYLNKKGWFDVAENVYTVKQGEVATGGINYPIHAFDKVQGMYNNTVTINGVPVKDVEARTYNINGKGKFIVLKKATNIEEQFAYELMYVSPVNDLANNAISTDSAYYIHLPLLPAPEVQYEHRDNVGSDATVYERVINGKTFYIAQIDTVSIPNAPEVFVDVLNDWEQLFAVRTVASPDFATNPNIANAAYIALYGTLNKPDAPAGVSDQEGKTQLETTNRNLSPSEFRQILPVTFPEMWAQRLTRGVLQNDGSVVTRTYVPVPIPNGSTMTSPRPITGTATQTNIHTKIDTLPKSSQKTISNSISTTTDTSTAPPTGDKGTTLPLIPPKGDASSMWAVYNPSQSELNSFGAWMWSSNLFEQIGKLFNDPMQAIIGIHKVFCSPSIGGRKPIKVGYINSGVESNVVSNQYTTVNCGSVSLSEYFGNVFDYAPFTNVKLYLPFVGVVNLDVADVMRSTITVEYGIDVFTGDCLAKVIVNRDGVGGVLYSYPGNCAVKYPYSSGSYLGILGFGASAVLSLMTGVPLFTSPAGGLSTPHGGSFAGNSGATGPKIPYLVVSRPESAVARNFNSFEGYPVNFTAKISDCRGYIRVKECHLSGINATDDELDMIDQILKDGIIVQS